MVVPIDKSGVDRRVGGAARGGQLTRQVADGPFGQAGMGVFTVLALQGRPGQRATGTGGTGRAAFPQVVPLHRE